MDNNNTGILLIFIKPFSYNTCVFWDEGMSFISIYVGHPGQVAHLSKAQHKESNNNLKTCTGDAHLPFNFTEGMCFMSTVF